MWDSVGDVVRGLRAAAASRACHRAGDRAACARTGGSLARGRDTGAPSCPGSRTPGPDPASRGLSAEGAGPAEVRHGAGRGALSLAYVAPRDSEMRPVAVETEGP